VTRASGIRSWNGARGAAAALAALLLAVALIPISSASGTESPACLWQKHTKRVTKKVKRRGKVRRVKRTKRWWTCVPVPASTAAPPVIAPPPPAPPPTEEEAGPRLERLGVKANDRQLPWSFTLSRPQVPAGELIVELQNQGEDPHDLNLELEGSSAGDPLQIPVTGSLEQRSARFTLPAGTYRLWCDLPEHDEKGMHAELLVG